MTDIRVLAKRGVLVRVQQLYDEINAREAEITKLVDGNTMPRTRPAAAPIAVKLRWQQTPEGRAKLSRSQKRRWRLSRADAKA